MESMSLTKIFLLIVFLFVMGCGAVEDGSKSASLTDGSNLTDDSDLADEYVLVDDSDLLIDSGEQPPLEASTTVRGTVLFSTTTDGVVVEGTNFPLHSIQDLNVSVSWENVNGDHEMVVHFYSPDGQLYLRRNVSFSSASSTAAPKRTKAITGIPHLKALAASNGETTKASISLPIGGTWITSHGLSGIWRVEALLDDGISVASATFTLTN